MYYVAQFDYEEREQDASDGGIGSRMVYFTMFVEAEKIEGALESFSERIKDLHKTNEIFYDVDAVYLQTVVEMEDFPTVAKVGQWFSLASLGKGFAELSTVIDGEADGFSFKGYRMGADNGEGEFEPFISFDEDYEQDGTQTPLYFEFLRGKRYGKSLKLGDVDEGTIDYLRYGEGIPVKSIGRLFDASPEDIKKLFNE